MSSFAGLFRKTQINISLTFERCPEIRFQMEIVKGVSKKRYTVHLLCRRLTYFGWENTEKKNDKVFEKV